MYLTLSYFIGIETDERLLDTRPALQFQLSAMDSLPSVLVISDDVIEVTPIAAFSEYEMYSDTMVWDAIEKEFEPYRKFTYHDQIHGQPYRIALSHTRLDSEALVDRTSRGRVESSRAASWRPRPWRARCDCSSRSRSAAA